MSLQMIGDYKSHRLYDEFFQLRSDDKIFADLYEDTEGDFLDWCMDYEIDTDWGDKSCN